MRRLVFVVWAFLLAAASVASGDAGDFVARATQTDGRYSYQHGPFNRLVQVNEIGSLVFNAHGAALSASPGDCVMHCVHDALGRRIHKEVPWAYEGDARWTWYYHDGVRRVMEVNRDPLPQAGIGGNPEPQGSYVTYADREYVWGPDYVDECLWQVDRPGATAFVLQDANFNVVALVDPQGHLLRQYDYDAYGQPIAADTLGAFGHNRVGHQGLFADRFDADAPAADLAVGAELLYYARNRDYSPRLGRWVQRDPNGTGAAMISSPISHGGQCDTSTDAFDAADVLRDGANLYAWPAPNFCTTVYESLGSRIGTDAGRCGGRGAAPTGATASVAANVAGGTYPSELCGR